jgi:carboxylesterase type B
MDGEGRFAEVAARIAAAYSNGAIARRVGPPDGAFVALNGDYMFRLPSLFLANLYSAAAGRCWVYRLDRCGAIAKLGATHALDLHFVFNSWWCAPYFTAGWSPEVQHVSDAMSYDFLSFVCGVTPEWNLWDAACREPVRIYGAGAKQSTTAEGSNLDEQETSAWGELFDTLLRCQNGLDTGAQR